MHDSASLDSLSDVSSLKKAAIDFVAGLGGGCSEVIVGHPFDTVKVKLQMQPTGEGQLYKGMIDCLVQTWKLEGIPGLFKGVASPLVGLGLLNASMFFSYGYATRLLNIEDNSPNTLPYLAAGGLVGVATSFVESPVDLFKCKMQVQGPHGRYKSVIDCAKHVISDGGLRGVYQGLSATFLRDIPATGCYFFSYEWSMRRCIEFLNMRGGSYSATWELPASYTMLAGGIAGLAYWAITYPMDVIKTAIQSDANIKEFRKYKGIIDCTSQLYAEGGLSRFFRGITPCLVRSFPANAACFLVYERLKHWLQ